MSNQKTVLNAQTITTANAATHEKKAVFQTSDIMSMFGISRATVWRWIKDGTLPAPIKMGARLNVWRVADIDAFVSKMGA
jgi:predicted DNA-binding transcriptional regulator AlpA